MEGNWSKCEKPAESLHAIEYRCLIPSYSNYAPTPLKKK